MGVKNPARRLEPRDPQPNAGAQLLQPSDTPQEARREVQRHTRAFFHGRRIIGLGLGLLVLFGLVTALVVILDPLALDVPITRAVQEISDQPVLGSLLADVSLLGFAPWNFILPAILILGLVLLKRGAEAVFLLLATAASAMADVVKALVQRARPSVTLADVFQNRHLDGSSFPSGHVVEYTLVCGFCFYLAYTLLKPGALRTALLITTGALIVLVGPSRIYMGQHWASDVLGGYTLGCGLLMLIIWAYRRWEVRHTAAEAERAGVDQAPAGANQEI